MLSLYITRGRTLGGALAVAGLLAVTIQAVPAGAAETTARPPSDSFTLEGRGHGHGRGMSQNGARGAATHGLTVAQILAFYYPGTSLTGQPNTDIRVGISTASSTELVVDATPGMRLVWRDGTLYLPDNSMGSPIRGWRLYRPGGALNLQFRDSTSDAWHQYSYVPGTSATLASSSERVRLVQPDQVRKEVRGGLRGAATGSASSSSLQTVNVLPMEDYLRSVVPSEMPASWPAEALSAQAVAARTYASRLRYRSTGMIDTCDTVSCQVYNGVATYTAAGALIRRYEAAETDAAIARTASTVVITGGAFSYALTEFSAANGGWTADGGVYYMPAQPDPYDGVVPSSSHSWTMQLPVSNIERAYPQVGRLSALTVLSRDGRGTFGGRIVDVRLQGTTGAVTVPAAAFRSALGLKSTWWSAMTAQTSGGMIVDVTGDTVPDVLARNGSTGALMLYRGAGAGSLASPSRVGIGWETLDQVLSPGDLDRDGRSDLLGRDRATGGLWFYPGDGLGAFPSRRLVGTGWGMHDILITPGDVTGDGVPDVFGREATTGRLWLYAGDGAGGSSSRVGLTHGWAALDAVVGAGDVDGNGSADLLGREQATGHLWLYTFTRDGSYGLRKVNSGWHTFDMLVGSADLDRDGRFEIIGRLPGASAGTLRSYPVLPGGEIAPGRDIGTGWNMHDAIV